MCLLNLNRNAKLKEVVCRHWNELISLRLPRPSGKQVAPRSQSSLLQPHFGVLLSGDPPIGLLLPILASCAAITCVLGSLLYVVVVLEEIKF